MHVDAYINVLYKNNYYSRFIQVEQLCAQSSVVVQLV